jgi:hypothetical protein
VLKPWSYVSSFDYHIASVSGVRFNVENLLPELDKIELREIYKKDFAEEKSASVTPLFGYLTYSYLTG